MLQVPTIAFGLSLFRLTAPRDIERGDAESAGGINGTCTETLVAKPPAT
jgi:hypothetical protein